MISMSFYGHIELVELLLNSGPDVYAAGYARDASHAAAEGGSDALVTLLLHRGYRVRTPLLRRHGASTFPASPAFFPGEGYNYREHKVS